MSAQSDDECILTFEGVDESGGIVVVDFCDADARWECCGAVMAGDGCDGVLFGREEGGGHVPPTVAACLHVC